MASLVDRTVFRSVLKEMVKCLRKNLDVPGVPPLAPELILSWFNRVTLEDLQAVTREIDREQGGSHSGGD
jgi:hypothetical protein